MDKKMPGNVNEMLTYLMEWLEFVAVNCALGWDCKNCAIKEECDTIDAASSALKGKVYNRAL